MTVYEIGSNIVNEWFVYDMEACCCCAGPMTEAQADIEKARLEREQDNG
jgi:hypothetical protein